MHMCDFYVFHALTDLFQSKQLLLRNVEYLEDELDVLPVIDYFLCQKKITAEQEIYILKAGGRRARVRRFLSMILDEFDISTYDVLKASIPERNGYILCHLENDDREFNCS